MQPGQPRGILGRLALRIVEISGHGDDRAGEFSAQRRFGAPAQGFENFRRDFDRTLDAGAGFQAHHTRRVEKAIGRGRGVRQILEAAPHEAFDGNNSVVRIFAETRLRGVPDFRLAVRGEAHHGRQQGAAVCVVDDGGGAIAHCRHQRIGRAQVDAHRQPVLVGRGA